MELESYTFVLLRRGPRADEYDDEELDRIQNAHLSFLDEMRAQGHMVLSGPFRHQQDETKRGFSLYRTDLEQTRGLIENDPAIRAGRMAAEAMTWLTKKGALG